MESSHFEEGSIDASKLATGSVTGDDLDLTTFTPNLIAPYLAIEKGGTGTGNFEEELIVFSDENPTGNYYLSQSEYLRWDSGNLNLIIGDENSLFNTPEMVSVVENIFVSDALIINDYGDDTYQYIIDDSNNSLYLTNRLALMRQHQMQVFEPIHFIYKTHSQLAVTPN